MPTVDSWEKISYINRPVEIHGEGKYFTLYDALRTILPELFTKESSTTAHVHGEEDEARQTSEETGEALSGQSGLLSDNAEIKLVRIQGIEPQLEIPFGWVVNNLMNPEHYLHICVYVKVVEAVDI